MWCSCSGPSDSALCCPNLETGRMGEPTSTSSVLLLATHTDVQYVHCIGVYICPWLWSAILCCTCMMCIAHTASGAADEAWHWPKHVLYIWFLFAYRPEGHSWPRELFSCSYTCNLVHGYVYILYMYTVYTSIHMYCILAQVVQRAATRV